MMKRLMLGVLVAAVVSAIAALPSVAAPSPATVGARLTFVAPTGTVGAPGGSCRTAAYSSVQAAVEATSPGGTVLVCPGTYAESVTIDRSLTLQGLPGATIDATGQPYGIGTTASYVTIEGLTVEHASAADDNPGDGIITAGFGDDGPIAVDHVSIIGNTLTGNDGAGIDLNSTSYSSAIGNDSESNGIGINMSDDLGVPASHNRIVANVASNNPGGCGIVLADHSGVGIFANVVTGNRADDNGLGTPSAPDASSGSGVILAGGGGGVYDNSLVANEFSGNGHAGVAIHAHAPGMDMSGNTISYNDIGTNNLRTDFADTQTTGVYIGDASPLTITVAMNRIHEDHYGIFTAGSITLTAPALNIDLHVAVKTGSTPSFS